MDRHSVITLCEVEGYSASSAGRRMGIPASTARRWIQEYRATGQTDNLRSPGRPHVSTEVEDARLVNEARLDPLRTSRQLREASQFPGSTQTALRRLRHAGLRGRVAAVKERLSDEHKIYRLAFAHANVDRNWENVAFSDESIFTTSNQGRRFVYRPRGTRYDPGYVAACNRSGRVSISCWGWISSRGAGQLHRIEGHLDSAQYLHIMSNIMVPSVRVLQSHGVIQFQQDQSPIHTSRAVQEWFAGQPEIDLIDWPPRGADLNPMENMWAEVKRTLRDSWPEADPPRTQDDLWDLVSDAWLEVGEGDRFVSRLIDSMPRRMERVINAEGSWTQY